MQVQLQDFARGEQAIFAATGSQGDRTGEVAAASLLGVAVFEQTVGGEVDGVGTSNLLFDGGFGGSVAEEGRGIEEVGDIAGFSCRARERREGDILEVAFIGEESDGGHGGIADDEGIAVGSGAVCGDVVGELQDLDGGGGEDGMFFQKVFAVGVFEGGEGDEEEFALGNEDDVFFGIGGEEVGDGSNEQVVELGELAISLGAAFLLDFRFDFVGNLCIAATANADGLAGGGDESAEVDVGEGLLAEGDVAVGGNDPDVELGIEIVCEVIVCETDNGILNQGGLLLLGKGGYFFQIGRCNVDIFILCCQSLK